MKIQFINQPNHGLFKNLVNKKFDRLTVLGYAGKFGTNHQWWCECSCPEKNIIKVSTSNLKMKHTRSCGCLFKEVLISRNTTHNKRFSSEYSSYRNAKSRCNNPNNLDYHHYGGRGIKFKFKDFQEFYENIGNKPEPKSNAKLERIDNNGHYEIGNMRWANQTEQMRNTRKNRLITWENETKCVSEWAEIYNISASLLNGRLKLNWCINCSLTIQPRKGKCTHR